MAQLNLPQLEAGNFNNWKFRVKILLEEKQVINVLETDIINIQDATLKEEMLKKDAKAKSIIVQCITDKHLDLIKDSETAKDMMKVLEDIFERKSTFTKLNLKRKLLTLKCNVNDKLEDHFLKFDTIVRELENTGTKMDECDKICHLLLTLHEGYNAVITAIETLNTNITMDFVKSRLLDEELKMKNNVKTIKSDEVVFKALPINCFKCGKRGHKAIDCKTNARFINRGGKQKYAVRDFYRNAVQVPPVPVPPVQITDTIKTKKMCMRHKQIKYHL